LPQGQPSTKRDDPYACLNQYLEVPKFQDYCPNGLQGKGRDEARKIVSGVPSSVTLPEAALAARINWRSGVAQSCSEEAVTLVVDAWLPGKISEQTAHLAALRPGTPVHRYSGSCVGAPLRPGLREATECVARQTASCTVSSGSRLRKAQ